MKWKQIIADYFTFSLRDRVAIICLVALILIIFFLPQIITTAPKSKLAATDTALLKAAELLNQHDSSGYTVGEMHDETNSYYYQFDRTKSGYLSNTAAELFYFDPNTLSATGWQKLGLRDKTITTIQNYLGKGGTFKKPGDLKKIYGLSLNEYERLAPFIKIITFDKNSFTGNSFEKKESSKTISSKYNVIDINTADTTAFIALPGIGSKLAYRIINFRDKLGGFYSVEQIGETFGLPDSTFQKIKQYLKLENTSIRKININTASIDELKAHPYIKWSIANPIIAYRNEHGPYLKVEDIKKVMVVTEEIYEKIFNYLSVN